MTDYQRLTGLVGETAAHDHALRVVLEEEVRRLWQARLDWRQRRFADWPPERNAQYQELRTLVGLMRKARDISREHEPLHLQWPSEVRARSSAAPDPIDLAKAYAEWTEGEKQEAFGG